MEGRKPDDKNAPDRTGGEVLFDNITYNGIGWIGNAILSVYVTDKALHGGEGWGWLHDGYHGAVNAGKHIAESIFSSDASVALKEKVANAMPDIMNVDGSFSQEAIEALERAYSSSELSDTAIRNQLEHILERHTAEDVLFSLQEFTRDTSTIQDFLSSGAAQDILDSDVISAIQQEIQDKSVLNNMQELLENGRNVQAFHQIAKENNFDYAAIAEKIGNDVINEKTLKELSSNLKTQQIASDSVSSLLGIIALCSGGFLLLAPMKGLEDNKLSLTKFLDDNVVEPFQQLIGNAPTSAEGKEKLADQKQARYDYIENSEAPQTYGSLIKSRIQALLPIYALHIAWAGPNNVIKEAGALASGNEFIDPDPTVGFGGFSHYMNKAGDYTSGFVLDNVPGKMRDSILTKAGGEERFKEIVENVITDMSYSYVAASLLYVFSRINAGLGRDTAGSVDEKELQTMAEKESGKISDTLLPQRGNDSERDDTAQTQTTDPQRTINSAFHERISMQPSEHPQHALV